MAKVYARAIAAVLLLISLLVSLAGEASTPGEASERSQAPFASSQPFELQPRTQRASLQLRRPTATAMYNAIAQAYGIHLLFDKDFTEPKISSDFQIEDATLRQALEVAANISKTFVSPVDEHTGIVAPDTAQKRSEYERQILGSFLMDGETTAQQLTEVTTAMRTMLDLRRVTQNNRLNWITVLGRTRQLEAANEFVRGLQRARGEVMLDVDVLEVDSQRARTLGVVPPQPAQLLYLGLSGAAAAAVPVLAFGGGRTLYGVNLPGATFSLTFTSSAIRSQQRLQLRAEDGQEASLLVGERYPLVTGLVGSSFFPLGTTPIGGSTSTNTTTTSSNSLPLTVAEGAAGPSISTITTTPDPPVAGQEFTFTITGSGFDAATAEVTFTGSACPCTVTHDALTLTDTTITGTTTLNTASSYAVAVTDASGATSNSVSITVSAGGGPAIASLTTSPSPVFAGQQFNFTIAGTGFVPSTAQVLFTGTGCTPCTISNAELNATSTTITGSTTLIGTGSYSIIVANGSDSQSNAATITVSSAEGPSISGITTSPNPPAVGKQFSFTINGGGFDFFSAVVLITGPGCAPCSIPTAQLTFTLTSITGVFQLNQPGTFGFVVQNNFGAPSNTQNVTVGASGLLIGSITTVPSPPVAGQQFTFTINGSGFDPATAQVLINGTDCPPCAVVNASLSVKSTEISGSTSLKTAGNYTVTVTNSTTSANAPTTPSASNLGSYPAIQYEDLGVKVKATPYLHAGGELTLKLDLSFRSIGTQTLNGNPIISNRQVTEQVRLRDGESHLISGILGTQSDASVSGYPWLARLPLIGPLFGSHNKKSSQTEFIMMISPHIVRHSAAEDYMFGPIYFGKELQGLPPEPPPQAPVPAQVPPGTPAPGVPPQPGVPQPGQPQPGVPGVAPLPGAPPGFVQPIPQAPGAQPGVPQQPGFPPGMFPRGVIPQPGQTDQGQPQQQTQP